MVYELTTFAVWGIALLAAVAALEWWATWLAERDDVAEQWRAVPRTLVPVVCALVVAAWLAAPLSWARSLLIAGVVACAIVAVILGLRTLVRRRDITE